MRAAVICFLGLSTVLCLIAAGYLAYNNKPYFWFMLFSLLFGSGTADTLDNKE